MAGHTLLLSDTTVRSDMRKLVTGFAILIAIVPVVLAGQFLLMSDTRKAGVLIKAADIAHRLLDSTENRVEYEPFFRRLHAIALHGLGAGVGGTEAEANAMNTYRDRLSPKPTDRMVFIDGGAFEGEYTLALLNAFRDFQRVEVHAFEPAAAFTDLQRRFQNDQRVHANRLALADAPGELALRLDDLPQMNSLVASLRRPGDRT